MFEAFFVFGTQFINTYGLRMVVGKCSIDLMHVAWSFILEEPSRGHSSRLYQTVTYNYALRNAGNSFREMIHVTETALIRGGFSTDNELLNI